MKKLLSGICLLFTSLITDAQTQGLENIIVEKYYVSNAADSIGASGNGDELPVGSVTYRIFVDMLPGYKFQAAYGTQDNSGIPLHTLSLNTTTSFYNNTDRGHEIPSYSKTNAAQNTTMLDSWFSAGAACTNNYGILKADDGVAGGANVNNANGLLQNNDPAAGIPLTTADGIYLVAPAPSAVTFVNLAQAQADFDGGPSSSSFITSNGSWASLTGATGPTAANRVLIGQFTTNGCFSFELNLQIGTPTGGFQNYVAKNPTGNEILFPGLTYPLAASNTASVSVSANPTGPVCAGTNVTFTATPVNGGNAPDYQWLKNGLAVGTGITYSDNVLNNNDQVSCVMTSNQPCVSGSPDTSNVITMIVDAAVSAEVTISSNPSGPVCSGTNVTFTATPANGGTNPVYQWLKNGLPVGTGDTYADNTLSNNDQVSCVMTSNQPCVTGSPDTSNVIDMVVDSTVTPSVSISSNPAGAVCAGTLVTFTATEINGGANPVFQWLKNGLPVGTGGNTYSDSTLNNNDQVSCELTSDLPCVSGNPVTSNVLAVIVNSPVASVSITSNNAGAICAGTNVKFTAIPVNGGTAPSYQWKKNGLNVGGNSPFFSNTSNLNNFTVSCEMTSNEACVSGNPATSNTITVTVNPVPVVNVTTAGPTTFCRGVNPLTLSANSANAVSYQWRKGSSNILGAVNQTYVPIGSATYKAVATSLNGCTGTSNGVVVTVNPLPMATIAASGPLNFCAGDSVELSANGGTGLNYQWKKGNSTIIPGATNQSLVVNSQGGFKVLVTNTNTGCAKTSAIVHTTVNCRDEISYTAENSAKLNLYPNPSAGPFTLKLFNSEMNDGTASVEILNVIGQTVYAGNENFTNGQLNLAVNTAEQLPRGIYFVKVKVNGVEYSSKLVLQ